MELQRKEAIRILRARERRGFPRGERDFKRVLGGLLVQDRDGDVDDREIMQVDDVSGAVLASDAFLPFPNGSQAALDAGVTAISSRAARSAMPR